MITGRQRPGDRVESRNHTTSMMRGTTLNVNIKTVIVSFPRLPDLSIDDPLNLERGACHNSLYRFEAAARTPLMTPLIMSND
jgi:hypothetical protein